jgi:vitamin B12/bleomycin/antimicrobial peptide transport system ATP-binding/permease protein
MSPFHRKAWKTLWAITAPFFRSHCRWRAIGALTLLVGLLLTVSCLNYKNSFVGRDFMTALAERHAGRFAQFALAYVGVFAAITAFAVLLRFTEERLGLFWRTWLTGHLIDGYLGGQTYYRLTARPDIDNPDQRITEDVKSFTTTTLSFLLIILNASVNLVLFARLLWEITPLLFLAAVVYAAAGTVSTLILGRRLMGLNFEQLKREADLRYEMIRVREHAESIALYHGGTREGGRLHRRLDSVAENFRRIVAVNRNVGFFTTGFNYLTAVIPVLIVAPLYFNGKADFGVVPQAVAAFGFVLGSFSVIVTQFASISSFAAVVSRLGAVAKAVEDPPPPPCEKRQVAVRENGPLVSFEHLTLCTPGDGRELVVNLNLEVLPGTHLLVTGPNGAGKSALFRAVAGLWDWGEGTIVRPHWSDVVFLPARPYTVPGTLREQLTYACPRNGVTDERILTVLDRVKFTSVMVRVGGLDAERDWPNTLSIGEQQVLAFARLLLARPKFVILDGATGALDAARERLLYGELGRSDITYISIGDSPSLRDHHDMRLELLEDGEWRLRPVRDALCA